MDKGNLFAAENGEISFSSLKALLKDDARHR